jgi:hypothetical protein
VKDDYTVAAQPQKPVLLAVVNDIHAGSSVALCPPAVTLDDGGTYIPSRPQTWLWYCWERYWEEIRYLQGLHNARLFLVINGDLFDGDHHDTMQIVSRNPNAQFEIARKAIDIGLALNPEKIFVIRGTEAHVGGSACSEEGFAKGLLGSGYPVIGDPDTNTASHWHWRAEIQGVRLDVTHHGRTGQREHTRGSAIRLYAHDILLSYVKNDEDYPHLALRAHHHRFNDSGDDCPVRVVTSGAFQLKTGYVHKIAADSIADIGGLAVIINDGAYEVKKIKFPIKREVMKIA